MMYMGKLIISLLAAAVVFSAVSCGKTDEPAASSEAVGSSAVTETGTAEEDAEAEMAKFKAQALERADLTAQPMPDSEIPDDWHELSNGTISMYVPADVEDVSSEGSSMSKFQNEDKSVFIFIMGANDWSVTADEEDDEFTEYFPELKEENTAKALNELGLDYDGTRASFYKAVLSFTSKDRTEKNAEAFDAAALAKGMAFLTFPEVYYHDAEGHDIYAHAYSSAAIKGDLSDSEDNRFWIGAFADPNTEYTAMVTAHTKEEALQIASTIKIIG